MKPTRSSAVGEGLRFVALGIVVTVTVILLGWIPTMRIGGPEAWPAMLAGCVVSLLSSMIGAIPIVLALRGPARTMPQAILLATALRFLVVLILTLSAALSGWFDRPPLLVWIAISYLLLLVTDTIYAVHRGGSAQTPEK